MLYSLWYCEEERRRSWPAAAATRRAGPIRGAARRGSCLDPARHESRAQSRDLSRAQSRDSSLAYSREYAALLAPGAACGSAQRGRGGL